MLLLEFLTDLILEEDIGRRGAFRRIWILWFGIPLALLGSFVVLQRAAGLAFVLRGREKIQHSQCG